jgi:predicted porin
MKKTAFALAILALSGAASAQSSVVLFGIVDATIARGSGSTSSKTQLTNSGYNSARLGFRGVEDLGGGNLAGFHLEAGVSNDDGRAGGSIAAGNQATTVASNTGLNFNRRSTVSYGGRWGEVRLGRDYTPQFWNLSVYDPFGTNGVGTNQVANSTIGGPVNTRASNSITYLYGHGFGATTSAGGAGIHASVQYYMGENNSGTPTSRDGTGAALRVGYNGGPLSVAASYASTQYNAGDIRTANIGASYDFGVVRAMAMYDRDRVGAPASVTGTGYLVGALVPVGAGEIRLAHSRYRTDAATSPSTRKYALGYVHHMSKRTALYATFAHVSNSGTATQALNGSVTAAGQSSRGLDLGLRHSF